ncbi:MAG: hypothetical protein O3A00_21980, partial [Planctomycetota bacterium]|nr:hypothetical protein [Planctomycetota bacterium]
MIRCVALVLLLSTVACGQEPPQKTKPPTAAEKLEFAKQSGAILRRACVRCHKGEGSESGYAFNVLKTQSLLDEGMLVAGEPGNSEIFSAMFRGRMPPRNRPQLPRPSAADVETIRKWITAGAPAVPKPTPRAKITLKSELQAIYGDLLKAKRDSRAGLRYFSLAQLHNDDTVDEMQLDLTRLALAKVLNSLSWESTIVSPRAIDPQRTLYAVEIDKLGWSREHWTAIVRKYPYAVAYGALDDPELNEIDRSIDDIRRDRTPVVVRADWIISDAAKPPLYHELVYDLHVPALRERPANPQNTANAKSMTDRDLEDFVNVHVRNNIAKAKAQRAGFTESGVSGQNRLVERHPLGTSSGFYWKSYDFKSSNRTAILSEFPLGPTFEGNEFNDLAFKHDGGEIIFSLPNGLQAYLLVDARGNRIDAGPIEVVGDSLKTSGNEQIVTGLSCMACHRKGMIESPDDEVREFSGTVNEARDQVLRLYPKNDDFRALIDKDRSVFQRTMEALVAKFPVPSAGATFEELPEPVSEVARRYHLEPMTIET